MSQFVHFNLYFMTIKETFPVCHLYLDKANNSWKLSSLYRLTTSRFAFSCKQSTFVSFFLLRIRVKIFNRCRLVSSYVCTEIDASALTCMPATRNRLVEANINVREVHHAGPAERQGPVDETAGLVGHRGQLTHPHFDNIKDPLPSFFYYQEVLCLSWKMPFVELQSQMNLCYTVFTEYSRVKWFVNCLAWPLQMTVTRPTGHLSSYQTTPPNPPPHPSSFSSAAPGLGHSVGHSLATNGYL